MKVTTTTTITITTTTIALILASTVPLASAGCPTVGGAAVSFSGSCTLLNIETALSCTLNTLGFQPVDVKKACDLSA